MHPQRERSACGVGFVADVQGRPSHEMVRTGIGALRRLRHRGAVDADSRTGDGAGILLPLPRRFLGREAEHEGIGLDPNELGLAMVFIPDGSPEAVVRSAVEEACAAEGIAVLAWRVVPVEPEALGQRARATLPRIEQAFLGPPPGATSDEREIRAHRVRRRAERAFRDREAPAYLPSLSFRTVTYKALAAADQVAAFYPDLEDPAVEASFVLFHQRYSTNTMPTWDRAQPFRMLAHNGEINTLWGNVRRMRAREGRLGAVSAEVEALLRPVLDEEGSDSAMLDESVELLVREGDSDHGGGDVGLAVAALIPAAWENDPRVAGHVRDFYRFHGSLVEPWDGPAALVFTDGLRVGASLDRNGLRPLRYSVCEDGLVVCASEVGVVDLADRGGVRRAKLGPGQMLLVDPVHGLEVDPVGRRALRRPYGGSLGAAHVVGTPGEPVAEIPCDLLERQVAHGYTREELALVVGPAAATGREPTFSMGDDTPLAALSSSPRPLFHFFKQRFAQVTNPPLDHLRERFVMSLRTLLGPRPPLLGGALGGTPLVELDTFFLFAAPEGQILDATWPAAEGPAGLRPTLEGLGRQAVMAAREGHAIVLVSHGAVGPGRAPVPSVLAVGAVNAALMRAGLRDATSIVAAVDDAFESHHVACLIGCGAEAVHLRLALATVASLATEGRLRSSTPAEALVRYRDAIEEGMLKVMSKMGVSCIDSYRGAHLFDAVGIADDVVDLCVPGISSSLGGMGFREIAAEALSRHADAFGPAEADLLSPGRIKFRKAGEYHAANPDVVRALHRTLDPDHSRLRSTAAGDAKGRPGRDDPVLEPVFDDATDRRAVEALHGAVREPSFERYERFADLVNGRPPTAVRDLLEPVPAESPVPLEQVEAAADIVRRFSGAGISHGSIGREAHETLALAFNRIGARSNTGEGGEHPGRYRTERNSAIKQVASARFGVTPEYCAFADELQIKIAQGSKPGEGGQLPGRKVTEEIARLRHTRAGIALISPPPHHDIYSIEDLAQLIFDLKQVNPGARVSVKLVSEAGVGQIAAGVAKGLADVVHIAGADGGTGASPLSSIKNAGLPWELGLVEVQRVLAGSGLRDRVRLRVDGGLKTGRDVVLAALLGADEFSFGTAALVAAGCIMVRTCHLDTCPAGIATQDPDLRARFAGTPEMVATYMLFIAEEVRRILAGLGLRSLGDAVGCTELLRRRPSGDRRDMVDPSPLLAPAKGERRFKAHHPFQRPRSRLGDRLHTDAWPVVRDGGAVTLSYGIRNEDRSVGARLGGAIGHRFGEGDPLGRAQVGFRGQAGQSFGAFLARGVDLRLTGEANDYVGKSMSGGTIVIVPPEDDAGDPILVGNTVLYGATGGELFVAGRAGERFAVRNCGATAVIEGAGDHACEYMTGGTVVVLGPVGMNVGAGMTGGELYVHDPEVRLPALVNPELVEVLRPDLEALEAVVDLVKRHAHHTGSVVARGILNDRDRALRSFWRVAPRPDVIEVTRKAEGTLGRKG